MSGVPEYHNLADHDWRRLITLTRRVLHVKHPDLVRRCFTVSVPGALFLRTLDGFVPVVMFPPSGTTKNVVRGG